MNALKLLGQTFHDRKAGRSIWSISRCLLHEHAGQSLVETALAVPLAMIMVTNAVSIGYVFAAYLNLTGASRQGVEYSVQGTSSELQATVPAASFVSSLVKENIRGAISPDAAPVIRVCTVSLGLSGSGANQVPNCSIDGSGNATFSDPQPDPEAPFLVLHRVDVQYTLPVPMRGSLFNILPDSIKVHRMVTMRAIP